LLKGVSNKQGKVTFKICSTQHGLVRFKTPGVLIPGAVTFYVRGALSMPVQHLKVSSPRRGTASISWKAPTYTGGQPILSYQITLTAAGKKSVVARASKTALGISGLANATRYTVSVTPVTRIGPGRATSVLLSVA